MPWLVYVWDICQYRSRITLYGHFEHLKCALASQNLVFEAKNDRKWSFVCFCGCVHMGQISAAASLGSPGGFRVVFLQKYSCAHRDMCVNL